MKQRSRNKTSAKENLKKLRIYQALGSTGSVALEYVLVSTFATVVGIALLGISAHMFKHKLDSLLEKLAIDHEEFEFNIFEE